MIIATQGGCIAAADRWDAMAKPEVRKELWRTLDQTTRNLIITGWIMRRSRKLGQRHVS